MTSTWKRATTTTPCPICHQPDAGCLIAPGATLCRRRRAGGRQVANDVHLFEEPGGPLWSPWRRSLKTAIIKMINRKEPMDDSRRSNSQSRADHARNAL